MDSKPRLLILRVLVVSLLITLGGRLYYLQILSGKKYQIAAQDNRIREVITPATRGSILDESGKPLVTNRTAIVFNVSYFDLVHQKDKGKAVISRLAQLIQVDPITLRREITPCGAGVPLPCWRGTPQQPVPVKQYDINKTEGKRAVLALEEHQEDYPGVTAGEQGVRQYPNATLAAHALGYVGPINQEELDKGTFPGSTAVDLVGKTGLEQSYNAFLAGKDQINDLLVDRNERETGSQIVQPSISGDSLVLSLDVNVQKVAEKALSDQIAFARAHGHKGDAGAAIVLDAKSGRIIAIAGNPTYDPTLFVGGISTKNYQALRTAAGNPLVLQATQGQYAPGSTFKLISTSAVVKEGTASFGGSYPCPSAFPFGGSLFHNFEGEALGQINLTTALIKSCDTVFYKFAADNWLADGGNNAIKHPTEAIAHMAMGYGLGMPTGIDIPGEAAGAIVDRATKLASWKANKAYYCRHAKTGFSATTPAENDYDKALMKEACDYGYQLRGGDAVNQAVGQGDIVLTPLQLAVAYEALANGGTLMQPLLAKAAIDHTGRVVRTFTPKINGHVPVDPAILNDIRAALTQVPVSGTAAGAFAGFPLGQVPVAGKTGTAQVSGKDDTSWFASFAPANDPKFVVVGMVAQGGQGAYSGAQMVREIYDGIYGFGNQSAALPGGKTPERLPTVALDGSIKPPSDAPKLIPKPQTSGSPSPNPHPGGPTPSPTTVAIAIVGVGSVARKVRGRQRVKR